MEQKFYALLLLLSIGFFSCRKDRNSVPIKQYDQTQIENYIAANGITGMVRDTAGGDTTGIYYKIIQQAPAGEKQLGYADLISMVFTIKSFDGLYTQQDTINNHFYDYAGHIINENLPNGLELAVLHDLKYAGATMRVLIPSHLAYGVSGNGSGSKTQTNARIAGNQCLDYYINVVASNAYAQTPAQATANLVKFKAMQAVYDDKVIKNYMADSSLVNYTKITDVSSQYNGLYYKVLKPDTAFDAITLNSTITADYTGQLFNATIFDGLHNGTNYGTIPLATTTLGAQGGLLTAVTGVSSGSKISLLIPSALGYGMTAQSGIPANSCLRFTFEIVTVTP